MKSPRPIFLAGATATGKSELAIELAERVGGEIISVDSMQVYRGLDVGTAKASAAMRERVPHHLIDILELSESFDAARFVERARLAAGQIQGRGHVPIFCGGTGLYFKAYLEGLGESAPPDSQLRAELESRPLPDLLAELERVDPEIFRQIDRRNPRRVVRALEVARLTGRPFSEQRSRWIGRDHDPEEDPAQPLDEFFFFGLKRPSADLRRRIDERVDRMFEQGLVSETEALLVRGLEENRTAMQAIGYRQTVEFLRGKTTLMAAIALIKQRSRQYAKRQMTWFSRQSRLEWIEIGETENVGELADQLARRYADQSA